MLPPIADYCAVYKIKSEFSDGTNGVVDLKNDLDQSVFVRLKDMNYFKKFKLNSWIIVWENGAGFAPEYLYSKVRSTVLIK